MRKIDEIIHQPIRLQLMAALVALRPGEQMEFSWLRDLLEVTDGNLGAHLLKLENAGYIDVEKAFVARRPKTFLSATDRGRAAFADNVEALREIMSSAEPPRPDGE
jgi:DNA-binding MarR family transcriptional regulator